MELCVQVKVLIAIITCRRPQGLTRLLEALQRQKVNNLAVEILVVDNACQPQIEEIILQLNNLSTFKIHYAQEPIAGIVAARNRCTSWFLGQQFDSLVFIDDDEWPETELWLQNLVYAQQKYQTDIITSNVISVGEHGTPVWATKLLYGKNTLREGDPVKVFYTNNLLITKKVLLHFQPTFDNRFAMTGASDYHFAIRCINAGFSATFTEAPVIEEFPKSRATLNWFMRRGFRSGIGYTRSHLFEDPVLKAVVRCLILAVLRMFLGIGKCILGLLSLNRLKLTDGLFRLASAAGTVAGLFGLKHNEYKKIHGS